jgi:hypothetical protein
VAGWLFIFLLSLASAKPQPPKPLNESAWIRTWNRLTINNGLYQPTKTAILVTIIGPTVILYRYWQVVQLCHGIWSLQLDHLFGKHGIYDYSYLVIQVSSRPWHWSDVSEGKFLIEITERHIKEDGCFALYGLLEVIASLDCLFS